MVVLGWGTCIIFKSMLYLSQRWGWARRFGVGPILLPLYKALNKPLILAS